MDSNISSFQDLLNEDKGIEDIEDLQQEVDDLEIRVSLNTTNITNNTQNIGINTASITTLNNTVLLRDGSIDLDAGYNPSNAQSIATKDYVDTHSTSGNYLRTDGTNSMTADLNIDNNDLINANEIKFTTNNQSIVSNTNYLSLRYSISDKLRILNNAIELLDDLLIINGFIQFNNDFLIQSTPTETKFTNLLNIIPFLFTINNIDEFKIDSGLSTFENDVKINNGNLNLNNNQLINCDEIKFSNASASIISNLNDLTFRFNLADQIKLLSVGVEILNDLYLSNDIRFGNYSLIESSNTETKFTNINNNAPFIFTINNVDELKIDSGLSTYVNDVKITGDLYVGNPSPSVQGGNIIFTNNSSIENFFSDIRIVSDGTFNAIFKPSYTEFLKPIILNDTLSFHSQAVIYYSTTLRLLEFKTFYNNEKFVFRSSNTPTNSLEIYASNYVKIDELLDMNNNKISNVANGTVNTDAVNLGQVNTIVGNYLPLSGGTMSGNIDMGLNNIIVDIIIGEPTNNQISFQAPDIYALGDIHISNIRPFNQSSVYILGDNTVTGNLHLNNIRTYTGTNIDVDCNSFHISSGTSGDCKLILEADEDNNDENDTPQILMKADGGITEGAIFLNNNALNIVSSVSSNGGIDFKVTTTDSDYENANLALRITQDKIVYVDDTLDVKKTIKSYYAVQTDADSYIQLASEEISRDSTTESAKIYYNINSASFHTLRIIGAKPQLYNTTKKIELKEDVSVSNDLTVGGYIQVNSYSTINISSFRFYAYSGYFGLASGNINISVYAPNGRIVATEFDATSDRRCKENINNVSDDTVNRFMNLNAKCYNWKKDESKKKYFGFIAQDVIFESKNDETKDFDDLSCIVNYHDADDMKGGIDEITGINNPEAKCMNINYDSCIPLLHRALQIEKQKNEILNDKIETLEARLTTIENILNSNNIV